MTAIATTLSRGQVSRRRLDDYHDVAPEALLDEVVSLGRALDGARVLHVSAASIDRGVAELISTEVALLNDVGIHAESRVIPHDDAFGATAERMHDALEGRALPLRAKDISAYLAYNCFFAGRLGDQWDVIVVHDPEPVALIVSEIARFDHFVWRCHVDMSHAERSTWDFLRPFVWGYDASVFTLPTFVPRALPHDNVAIITPAIDPLATRNCPLPWQVGRRILASRGIDPTRPLIVQTLHLDGRDDPHGLFAVWLDARRRLPGLQLAFVAAIADVDRETWARYERLAHAVCREPDCHLLTNLDGMGPLEVNAFQREADVVVQKSLHPGFDLAVSEALWKGTPVVGDNANGIALQVGDDEGGVLVSDAGACVEAIAALLEDEELAAAKRRAGRERVRRDFLIPRLIRDDLALYARLLRASFTDRTLRVVG